MSYYAVTLGSNLGIFTSQADAINSVRNYPGGHYRTFNNSNDAQVYMKRERIEKEVGGSINRERTLSIPTASIATIKLCDTEYNTTIIGKDGRITKLVGPKERNSFLTSVIAISEILKTVDGSCIIVCTEPTIHSMYKESSKWISKKEGKYSQLISGTLQDMVNRSVNLTHISPLDDRRLSVKSNCNSPSK